MTSRVPPLAAVGLTGLAIATLATVHVLRVYLPTFNTTETEITRAPPAESAIPVTPGLARQVVFVVVDGLGFQQAHDLAELVPLRQRGVFRPLVTPRLTYTGPAITTMVTGLDPVDSGVRLNGTQDGVPAIDAVGRELGLAHVPVEVASMEWEPFFRLSRAPKDAKNLFTKPAFDAELEARRAKKQPALPDADFKSPAQRFSFVYIGDVDDAGHAHGAASPEYAAASKLAGDFVNRVAATMDFTQDSLIVVSDHGHLPKGGHGGDEPEAHAAFLLGVGGLLRSGVELTEKRPMRDVAPTLALLAGVRPPTTSLGMPMVDVIGAEDEGESFLSAVAFDQAARFSCGIASNPRCADVAPIAKRMAAHDGTAIADARALFDEITAAREEARDQRGRRSRLFRTLAALVVIGGFANRLRREWRAITPAGLAAPLAFVGPYVAYFGALGYRPTFSGIKPANFLVRDAMPATLLGVAATLALAFARPLGRAAPWWMMFSVTSAFLVIAAQAGWDSTRVVPALAGVLVFQVGPALPGVALAAFAAALVEMRRTRAALSTSAENL